MTEPWAGWTFYVSRRHPQCGFGPVENVGAGVNSDAEEFSPYYLEGEDTGRAWLYFSSARGGVSNIYVSEVGADGTFGPAEVAPNELRATLSWDGLRLLFGSNRDGGAGGVDVYVATRTRLSGVPRGR